MKNRRGKPRRRMQGAGSAMRPEYYSFGLIPFINFRNFRRAGESSKTMRVTVPPRLGLTIINEPGRMLGFERAVWSCTILDCFLLPAIANPPGEIPAKLITTDDKRAASMYHLVFTASKKYLPDLVTRQATTERRRLATGVCGYPLS